MSSNTQRNMIENSTKTHTKTACITHSTHSGRRGGTSLSSEFLWKIAARAKSDYFMLLYVLHSPLCLDKQVQVK